MSFNTEAARKVEDADLAILYALNGLKQLHLNATQVTDEGLAKLPTVRNWKSLSPIRRRSVVMESESSKTLQDLTSIKPTSTKPAWRKMPTLSKLTYLFLWEKQTSR